MLYWIDTFIPHSIPFLFKQDVDVIGQGLIITFDTINILSKLGLFFNEIYDKLLLFWHEILVLQNNISYGKSENDTFRATLDMGNMWFQQEEKQNLLKEVKATISSRLNIARNWLLSNKEKENLRQYYEVNKLLIDCLNFAQDFNKISSGIGDKFREEFLLHHLSQSRLRLQLSS